jgi:hypothetical protein
MAVIVLDTLRGYALRAFIGQAGYGLIMADKK